LRALQLLLRVAAFTLCIAFGPGETVAAFPGAKSIASDAGTMLDHAYGEKALISIGKNLLLQQD
jgi:hypothetical protein